MRPGIPGGMLERKPSRRFEQKSARQKNAGHIFSCLHACFQACDGYADVVNHTGELFPRGDLRKKKVRTLVEFASGPACRGRVFTTRVCRMAIRKLMRSDLELKPPRDPEESWNTWLDRQSRRLQVLVRSAKKRAMDAADTQVLPADCADKMAAARPFKLHMLRALNMTSACARAV